jgi:hypothetical protein
MISMQIIGIGNTAKQYLSKITFKINEFDDQYDT